ncbi:MAG: sulfite exporter TauE/SafE family protein [Dehalococcoidia bacterium]
MDFDLGIWIVSLLIGILIGLTGMGGGAVMTPILILVFDVRPLLAVGTDLAHGALTKTLGGWQHYRQGSVDMSLVRPLALGSVPGALLGVGLLELIKNRSSLDIDSFVSHVLGIVLVVVGIALFFRLFIKNKERLEINGNGLMALASRKKALLTVAGALVGFIVAISSVGSGTLIIALLSIAFPLAAVKIVGTDVFHAAILLSSVALVHLAVGNVDYSLLGNMLLGSIPGVLIGTRLSIRVPDSVLRTALAGILLVAGVKMI